ncbi:uncharacterized protein V6R79_003332 [Siganus canaliculatus]
MPTLKHPEMVLTKSLRKPDQNEYNKNKTSICCSLDQWLKPLTDCFIFFQLKHESGSERSRTGSVRRTRPEKEAQFSASDEEQLPALFLLCGSGSDHVNRQVIKETPAALSQREDDPWIDAAISRPRGVHCCRGKSGQAQPE